MKSSYTCFRHISEVMANLTITFTKLSLLNLFWNVFRMQMAGGFPLRRNKFYLFDIALQMKSTEVQTLGVMAAVYALRMTLC